MRAAPAVTAVPPFFFMNDDQRILNKMHNFCSELQDQIRGVPGRKKEQDSLADIAEEIAKMKAKLAKRQAQNEGREPIEETLNFYDPEKVKRRNRRNRGPYGRSAKKRH